MSRIYPEIDTSRRASDPYEKLPEIHRDKTENACNQIFSKAPALTKDFLDKMHHAEIANRNTCIFGYEMKTKQFWLLAGLFILFFSSLSGAILMWFTSIFDNAVFSNLVLTNDTSAYDVWLKPSPKPIHRVYIFNYTNLDEYETEDVKLHVQEVGPYAYEESMERINVKDNGDGTISYQEKRTFKFLPEQSQGHKQSDRVIVPNVPLLSGAAVNRHANFLTRLAYSTLLNTMSEKPFMSLPAHRFLFGYEDDLYKLSKSYMKLQNMRPLEKFGIFSSKSGVLPEVITIDSGKRNINKVGMIEEFDGKDELDHWSTDECNSFYATDGSSFPPKMVREKQPVKFFAKELCRSMPLNFEKEVSVLDGKIPAYRYVLPENVFDDPSSNPENQCFCNMESGECAPKGFFNVTPCAFGAPLFMSLPHFYNADQSIQDAITGLSPSTALHESYVDLHPTMGFMMKTKNRLQVNIQVLKSYGINQLDMFEDKIMLPLCWFEMSLEDKTLPEDMVSIIFQTTFTIKGVELGLKYGCLLTALVTLVSIFIVMKNRWQSRKRTISMRPLQRRDLGIE